MNEPSEVKTPPEVKPWVHRVVEAAGVFMPANADRERRMAPPGLSSALQRALNTAKTRRGP